MTRDALFRFDRQDHVTPLLEQIGDLEDRDALMTLLKDGEPYPDELRYSAMAFNNLNFKGSSKVLDGDSVYGAEELELVRRFCADPRTLQAIELLREAATYDYRLGNRDSYFHVVRLPEGQSDGMVYLKWWAVDCARRAREDPSRIDEVYEALCLMMRIQDLIVQGYKFGHYWERSVLYEWVFELWMACDREFGTPRRWADELSMMLDENREETIWLRCHDDLRVGNWDGTFDMKQAVQTIASHRRASAAGTAKAKTAAVWRKWLDEFELGIEARDDLAFFHRQLLGTRGVDRGCYREALACDERALARKRRGHILVMPYHANYIHDYHELLGRHELLLVGLAVNRYADDHGSLPESLQALVPACLPEVPVWRFPVDAPRDFQYVNHGDWFELSGAADGIGYLGQRSIPFKGRRTR